MGRACAPISRAGCVGAGLIDIGDDDSRAAVGEAFAISFADPVGAAGDNDHPIFQSGNHLSREVGVDEKLERYLMVCWKKWRKSSAVIPLLQHSIAPFTLTRLPD